MKNDVFRCLRRGIPLDTVNQQQLKLMAAIEQRNGKKQRALLLLHGFSSSPAVFRGLLPEIRNYDAIICPVLPGHASSIADFAASKASDWMNCAKQKCESLIQEFAQVDVMGLSLGGLLACSLSQSFSLNHLYLLAPAFDLHNITIHTLRLLIGLDYLGFRQLRSAAGDLYTDEHYEISYRTVPLRAIIELLTFIQQFQFSCPTCPTDVFLGCHDKYVDLQKVAARFAQAKQVKVHRLANSAHVLPLDGDMKVIIDYINHNVQKSEEPIYYTDHNHAKHSDPNHAYPAQNLHKP